MRYLITGGAGFIGSHLSERLLDRGDSVVALDNFSTGGHQNIKHLEKHPQFRLVCGSVTDKGLVEECIKGVDRVYHLASAVGVKLIIERPVETVGTIVYGASVVFNTCAHYRVPVLLTSTSEVYGKSTSIPFSEDSDSIIGPPSYRRWAYASAKALGEFLALAYWHQIRLPVVLVRLFNTVGPRQTGQYGMVIPRFVQQALAGQSITVYGTGEQSRCFCHVADAVTALVSLLDHEESPGELFNIGNNQEVTMNHLAKLIVEKTESGSEIIHIPYAEAYGEGFEDMDRRVPDLSKLKRFTGYAPQNDLEGIIDDVIKQYRSQG
ncbi:MAG: Bifunctional polymyxin resistance protein ArnA [Verrucomicrobia subdivision 3 bacterium]|nr:Bifunctional polymyxin resistance protein ArnA [Limisphaerales bacterium]MCS1415554.1 Bifunctional polymyxin resistance protein ArnA [Limisphaerales bacterium]